MEENKELTGRAKVNAERKAAKAAKEAAEKKAIREAEDKITAEIAAKNEAAVGEAAQGGDKNPETPAPGAPETPAAPAGDTPGGTPSPEFRGKGPEDLEDKTAPAEKQADPSDENDPAVRLAKEYAPLYPKNKTFYVTSDMQVFLEGDKGLAQLHQRGKEGQVTTVNID